MARLVINGDLTILPTKVVKTLANRSCGTEDIASRCCTSRDSIRMILHRLRTRGLVEHDGRRPRTWKLKDGLTQRPPTAPASPREFGKRWTPSEDARLSRMFWAGATYKAMGTALGCSQKAAQMRCYELNLSYALADALNGPEAA